MIRAIARLKAEHFDIVIAGGGINGCATLRDASLRGAKAALIEKDDFASGASGKTSKLIHGGIRYLELFDFKLVFEALHERVTLMRTVPERVKPLQFVIPVYKNDPRPLIKIKLGVYLYDRLAGGDNIRCHTPLSRTKLIAIEKNISSEGLKGGVLYCDAQVSDDTRLCLDNAISAYREGAAVANKVEVGGFIKENGRISGVEAFDKLSGEKFMIRSKVVINATGPWSNHLVELDNPSEGPITRPTKGIHIVYRKLPHEHAILVSARRDGRIFFIIPWHEFTLIGTTDTDYTGSADDVYASREELDYLLSETQRIFPDQKISYEGIITTYAALRPLVNTKERLPWRASREHLIKESRSGLISVVGGKYTTYRRLAEEVTDIAVARLGRSNFKKCVTASIGPPPSGLRSGPADPAKSLAERIEFSVKNEMANSLSDLFIRRLGFFFTASGGLDRLNEAADIMAGILNWTENRKKREIKSYEEEVRRNTDFKT